MAAGSKVPEDFPHANTTLEWLLKLDPTAELSARGLGGNQAAHSVGIFPPVPAARPMARQIVSQSAAMQPSPPATISPRRSGQRRSGDCDGPPCTEGVQRPVGQPARSGKCEPVPRARPSEPVRSLAGRRGISCGRLAPFVAKKSRCFDTSLPGAGPFIFSCLAFYRRPFIRPCPPALNHRLKSPPDTQDRPPSAASIGLNHRLKSPPDTQDRSERSGGCGF